MSYDLSILKEGIREYGVTLTDRQEEQFIRYYQLLVQWNEVMNLTAITEFDQVLLKHFADSPVYSRNPGYGKNPFLH